MIESVAGDPCRPRRRDLIFREAIGNTASVVNRLVVEDLGNGNHVLTKAKGEDHRNVRLLRVKNRIEQRLIVRAESLRFSGRLVEGSLVEIDIEGNSACACARRSRHELSQKFTVGHFIAGLVAEELVEGFVVDLDRGDPVHLGLMAAMAGDPLIRAKLPGDETGKVVFEIFVFEAEKSDDEDQDERGPVEPRDTTVDGAPRVHMSEAGFNDSVSGVWE